MIPFSFKKLAALACFGAVTLIAHAATEITVYSAFEAEDLARYKSAFEKANPDIKIKWVRDSTGVITAKLLAFAFAYGLMRTRMPGRGFFRLVIPVLAPSLLPAIGLVYLFGKQGLLTPLLMGADDMPHGRPTPMNMYRCFVELNVWPAQAVLKVDDTVPGIAEGVAAGCPTVGLALSGNEAGLTPAQFAAMSEAEKAPIRERSTRILKNAGADHVIDTVADLMPLLRRLGYV